MSVAWDTTNLPLRKLYGVQTGYIDNAIKTEYDSGRVVMVQKNSRNKRRYNVSYAATKTQETALFNWYANTLGGNAGTFTCTSLPATRTQQESRIESTPTSSGMNIKEINMVWVEV